MWNQQLIDAINLRETALSNFGKQELLSTGVENHLRFKDFKIIEEIGKGAFGTVFKVLKLDTGKEYAMKCLKKRTLIKKNQLRYAVTECNVLK